MTSKNSIVHYLKKINQIGFSDVVINVKPITGEVLFDSKIATVMNECKGISKKENFSYYITAGHKLNLRIHASMNIFVEGHNFYDRGLVFNQKSD